MKPRLGRWARKEYDRLTAADDMPAATRGHVLVERGIAVHAFDGATLLTDHWFAEDAADTTILIRTPYGRTGVSGVAKFFVERGHHVIVQSCRGTFGSSGRFDPFHHEADDGRAAMLWLRSQSWATGAIRSWGFSYVGVTQWALCDSEERPDSMVIGLSARRFDEAIIYPGGGFAMETAVVWSFALDCQELPPIVRLWRLLLARRTVAKASLAIPPEDAARVAAGRSGDFIKDWLAHSGPGDPWWSPLHFAESSSPPITLLAGWQDLFLLGGIADYCALRDRGDPVTLIVGDWTHHGPDAGVVAARELLRQFDDAAGSHPAPVRVEVSGGIGWRDLPEWPPSSSEMTWELDVEGRLVNLGPGRLVSEVGYRYDPVNPTPQGGGRSLNPFVSGRRDQRERERRSDVLVFTSETLEVDLTVIGGAVVDVMFGSSNPRADIFVRLCDVDMDGVSHTVTDSYLRMDPPYDAEELRRLELRLAPCAHRFASGHRIRLQISSGAHPLYLRNPGTEDPTHDFSQLVPSEQRVVLGGATPSALRLPVVP